MTATLIAFKPGATMQPAEPIAEALHLRRLLESQPTCLMRVGIDGLLLAVNDAALRLLGAEALSQALGNHLSKLIIPRHHERWDELTNRVRDGASGSTECELTNLSGIRRTILLQAVPLLDHADGVPSMILTARDIAAPHRLAMALREREVSQELNDFQKQLEQGFADRDRSGTPKVLEPREVDTPRIASEHAAELALLRQALAEEHQLALLLKEKEGRRLLDNQRIELEQVRAERQRLATLLEERAHHHQHVVAAHAAERAQLQENLAEEHQRELLLTQQEGQKLVDSQRAELEQVLAEVEQLTTVLREREDHNQRAMAEQRAKQAEAEHGLATAVMQQAEINKALADQRVEWQGVDENARNLESLALAGRAALEIGRELQTIMAAVDARTQHLLAQSSLEADHRHVVEALRGDAIVAASLARQVAQASVDRTEPSGASGDVARPS